MPQDRLRILHAIHDFLPRHRAGSEIYALELCQQLSERHHVSILCAEYDPRRPHGHLTWRVHEDLPVVELVNNWICSSFEETYRPPLIGERIRQTIDIIQPDVIHAHSFLNLSFELVEIAKARGIPVVATLHDYTLVCPSGGQRVHRSEGHICASIDAERCVRCFRDSPFYLQTTFGTVTERLGSVSFLHRAAAAMNRRVPAVTAMAAEFSRLAGSMSVEVRDIEARLASARRLFGDVALFAAPSESLATEFIRLGLDPARIRVADYGFRPAARRPAARTSDRVRLGFVGTLVWHKGLHVLIDAVAGLPPEKYELVVFGDPDVFPDYTRTLRLKAANLPVRFAGAFDRERVADAYGQIDLLVVPSLWFENSPLVIHEAFMFGVPVVGARIGGITDLLGNGEHGLLYDPPASPDALRDTLRTVIADPSRLSALTAPLPAVKSIAEDAAGWERVYVEAVHAQETSRPRA